MSSSEKEEILANVARVVRALITSAKPPVGLHSVVRDYAGIEGEPIPYRRLGYMSVVDMLKDTDEFNFAKSGNEVRIAKCLSTDIKGESPISNTWSLLIVEKILSELLQV